MSKNRIVLFCVLGVAVGLVLGVLGRDFIVANEAQEHSNEVPQPPAQQTAQQRALVVIASMQNLQSDLLIFHMNQRGQEVDLAKTLDTPEHIKEVLEKSVKNVEKYLDGNWIFQGNTTDWWIGYNLEGGFKEQASEVGKELVKRAETDGLYKDTDGNLYDGGGKVYMKVR